MPYGEKREFKKDYGPRVNEYIRVPQVQLIDDKGKNLGVVDTQKAKELALQAELDLVEVGAGANPPVCRIMNFSKYLYEQNKKKRQNKGGKMKELKEFRFTPVMDTGDTNTELKELMNFFQKDTKSS
jgi:translation initiation factor IF-3